MAGERLRNYFKMKSTARTPGTPGILISGIRFSWRPWRPGDSESYSSLEVLILFMRIENLLYLIISKTAVLEKAGMTGALRITLGRPSAEFLALHAPAILEPFAARNIKPVFDRP